MTIIVGAISRNGDKLPQWLRDALLSNLSRHPADRREKFEGPNWLLAKTDIGAYRCKGSFHVEGGPAIVVAGEPLPAGTARTYENRAAEVAALHDDLASEQVGFLQACTGTFCGAFYSPRAGSLTLFADKLGLRPIYYIVTPEFAAFTSALRIFESARIGTTEIDLRGIYETCAFGFPLNDRTCYSAIRTIGPAEIVRIDDESESHSSYFEWDRLGYRLDDEAKIISDLVAKFEDGVRRRLREDPIALAFLSGGLDSRAIVATLRKLGIHVFTFNLAPSDTQDRVFGTLAAEALSSIHHQVDVPLSSSVSMYRKEQLRGWVEAHDADLGGFDRRSCLWSGDGGSLGLGHIYMTPEMIAAFDRGDLDAGVDAYLRTNRISGASNSAMTRALRDRTREWHIEGVRNEIGRLQRTLDGRSLHLFLMLNDQRRHLAQHFEDIDIERFEFHLPFFDSNFLETVIRTPIRPFLRHELYGKWLRTLSPVAASVPWQAYPGHEPCPVAFEGTLRYQWDDYFGKAESRRLSQRHGKQAFVRLFSNSFPDHLIRRFQFGVASLVSILGWTSYGHVVRVGDTFARYWQQSVHEPVGNPRR